MYKPNMTDFQMLGNSFCEFGLVSMYQRFNTAFWLKSDFFFKIVVTCPSFYFIIYKHGDTHIKYKWAARSWVAPLSTSFHTLPLLSCLSVLWWLVDEGTELKEKRGGYTLRQTPHKFLILKIISRGFASCKLQYLK